MARSPFLEAAHAGHWPTTWPTTWPAFAAQAPAVPPPDWGGATWAQGLLRWSLSRLAGVPLDPAASVWTWLDDLIQVDLASPHAEETARLLFWASGLPVGRVGWAERTKRWQAWAEGTLGGPAELVDHLVTRHAHADPVGTPWCPIHTPQLAAVMAAYRSDEASLWQGLTKTGRVRLWGWLRLRDTFTRGRTLIAAPHAGIWPIGCDFEHHAHLRLKAPDPWQDLGAINLALAHPLSQPQSESWQALAWAPAGLATWDLDEPWPIEVASVWAPLLTDLQQARQAKLRAQDLGTRPSSAPSARVRRRV